MRSDVAIRFGQSPRRCRHREELSRTFVDLPDIHRTIVTKFDRGENQPRLETIIKVACALDVPVDELLDQISWRRP